MLKLHHTNRLGLEVWVITMGRLELHTFLSERIARTKFERIRIDMERAANAPIPGTPEGAGLGEKPK